MIVVVVESELDVNSDESGQIPAVSSLADWRTAETQQRYVEQIRREQRLNVRGYGRS